MIVLPASETVSCLSLALLLAYELDVMRSREWRLLPILRLLPEERVRPSFQLPLHLFLIGHVGVHGYSPIILTTRSVGSCREASS